MKLKQGAARRLYEAREGLGLSRTDLERLTKANGFRVSAAAIYNLEKNKTPTPYLRTLLTLAEALELDVADLVEPEPEEVAS